MGSMIETARSVGVDQIRCPVLADQISDIGYRTYLLRQPRLAALAASALFGDLLAGVDAFVDAPLPLAGEVVREGLGAGLECNQRLAEAAFLPVKLGLALRDRGAGFVQEAVGDAGGLLLSRDLDLELGDLRVAGGDHLEVELEVLAKALEGRGRRGELRGPRVQGVAKGPAGDGGKRCGRLTGGPIV